MHAPAATLNPFAGAHPVTTAPAELDAVRRATEAALRESPYYLERFGERGRLFGGSDGGWLATLARGDAAYVEEQVLWLGRVLAARGIPRGLLQRYLELLYEALVRTAPDGAAGYEVLRHACALLRRLRQRHLPEAEARLLAAPFAEAAGAGWAARLPDMGWILVCAAVDEADGVANAVESVHEWAADPARFPARWIAAVDATLASARGALRPRGEG